MNRYVSPGWTDWQAMPDYGELNGFPGYAGAYCMYNYTVNVNGTKIGARDGAAIKDVAAVTITALEDADIVMVDLPRDIN